MLSQECRRCCSQFYCQAHCTTVSSRGFIAPGCPVERAAVLDSERNHTHWYRKGTAALGDILVSANKCHSTWGLCNPTIVSPIGSENVRLHRIPVHPSPLPYFTSSTFALARYEEVEGMNSFHNRVSCMLSHIIDSHSTPPPTYRRGNLLQHYSYYIYSDQVLQWAKDVVHARHSYDNRGVSNYL